MNHDIVIVTKKTSIEKTIQKIDRSNYSFAFIIDENDTFISEIAIYKIRRLILSGLNCSEEIGILVKQSEIKLHKRHLDDPEFIMRISKLMELQNINYCPIVDNQKIINVYNKNELLNIVHKTVKDYTTDRSSLKNILVIGGAGYLGSVLTRRLMAKGYFVRILDNFIYGKKSIETLIGNKKIDIVDGDIRNIATIIESLKDIDAVVLLAAVVGDPASKARPTQTIETNLLAAQTIAAACKNQQINRFIYASTCSVYGKGDDILDENSNLNPVSLYARTKIASEKSIMEMANESFSPTILRMSTLYGYSPRMRFDLVVNTMSMKAYLDNEIQVFGGGKQWRPLLHVKDAAEAYIKCLEAPIDSVGKQVFNVGSQKQNYQIIDLAKIVKENIEGVEIDIEKSTADARDYKVSFKKIEKKLNFIVENNIADSVKVIYSNLLNGEIKNPLAKIYYNHYFDSTEEEE